MSWCTIQVKIKTDMLVYHVPGYKQGLKIADMEGEVKANIEDYKGLKLSPNYPWRIALSVTNDEGKTKKFFVHLVRLLNLACLAEHCDLCSSPVRCCKCPESVYAGGGRVRGCIRFLLVYPPTPGLDGRSLEGLNLPVRG